MLDRLNTDNIESFRESIANALVEFLKNIRAKDTTVRDTSNYNFLQEIKGELISDEIPLNEIINKCKSFKINKQESSCDMIDELIKNIIKIEGDVKYQKFFTVNNSNITEHDKVKTLFSNKKSSPR